MNNERPHPDNLHDLEEAILAFSEGKCAIGLDEILWRVCSYQAHFIPALGDWWRQRGFDPQSIKSRRCSPTDVPAVPTNVFRHVKLCSNEEDSRKVYRTSGTSDSRRGEHWRISTRVYDLTCIPHLEASIPTVRNLQEFLPLVFNPKEVPDSSLSHMAAIFAERWPLRSSWFLSTSGGVRTEALAQRIEELDLPVLVLGTAFAYAHLIESNFRATLPQGSIILETGGYKGLSVEFARDDLYSGIAESFGIPRGRIFSEYSMTELSSQLYSVQGGDPTAALAPPPWCVVQAADPETLEVLPAGKRGLLRFVDLGNADSCVAVQTSDFGVVSQDGLVHLHGRALDSMPRGCSLAVEELMVEDEPRTDP